jgi:hypothetical protein
MKNGEIILQPDTVLHRDLKLISHQVSIDSTGDFQSLLSPSPAPVHSFFTSHELKAKDIHPHPFVKFQPDWILGLLLLCFILLAWVQVFYRWRFRQILVAPFSRRFLSQLVRDGDLFSERISLAAGFIYFICVALFFYQLSELVFHKEPQKYIQGLELFALICIFLLGFWIFKVTLIWFLSFIFRTGQTSREYLLNILIINISTGILLLPFLVFDVYLKCAAFLWICLIIFILLFVFRLIRGFLIGISITKFSYVFLFVYLCTLEILPLIVLLKVVLKYYL